MAALATSVREAPNPKYQKRTGVKPTRKLPEETRSFVFVDQNAIAAEQSYRARHRPSSKIVQLSATRGKNHDQITKPPPITESLLEHQSICYFIATHVASTKQHGFLDQVPSLYKTQTPEQLPCLNTSIEALALASYAHLSSNARIAVLARKRYADALKLMNAALADKKDSMSDSTLYSINLLSMYETMTAEDETSLDLTKRHWRGALSLVAAKGMSQLASPFARRNFVQVVTTAMQAGMEIPPTVLGMCRLMIQMLGTSDPTFNLWRLVLDAHELGRDLQTARDGLGVLLARASAIDEALVHFCHDPPEPWKYTICYNATRNDIIFRGKYHVYPTLGVASVWQVVWLTRMRVQGLIRKIMLSDQTRLNPSIDQSTCSRQSELCLRTGQDMSEMILASTPQFLGYIQMVDPAAKPSPRGELDVFDEVKSPESISEGVAESKGSPLPDLTHHLRETPFIKPYAGYMIKAAFQSAMLWPDASVEARTFAAKTLRTVGHTMGVGQAIVLADILERLNHEATRSRSTPAS